MSDWATDFWELDRPVSSLGQRHAAQRGIEFEEILWRMLSEAHLEPRTRYKPAGEEIDGSFVLDGRVFLLEAKWTADPIPASTLYQFRGKVDGKLVGTVGVFVSMGGYSKDAVDALLAGKTLNLILVAGDEIRAVASRTIDIENLLRRKLRAAAEEGTPFAPVLDTVTEQPPPTLVLVEGISDRLLLQSFISALERPGLGAINIVAAHGRINLGHLANLELFDSEDLFRPIVVVDGDGNAEAIRRHIQQTAETLKDDEVFVLEPSMDEILNPSSPYESDGWDPRVGAPDFWVHALGNSEFRRLLRRLGILGDDD